MASSTSTDLKLELITTGEKSGTWGTITNTNLQILEQAASGYLSLAVGGADVALSLATYATSNGKNLYYKLTGTLTANRTVTMPDTAERVFIVEDATARSASNFTLTIKTVSGTGLALPVGSTTVLYSDGTNITGKLQTKGYYKRCGHRVPHKQRRTSIHQRSFREWFRTRQRTSSRVCFANLGFLLVTECWQ